MKPLTHHEYLVNRLRHKVADAICDKDVSWEMAYDALIAMHFFENWNEEDFYERPVDISEVTSCVWDYYWPNGKPNPPLQEIHPFLH